MKKYIIIAACFIAIMVIAYFVRSEMLKKEISKNVGDSDQLKEDLSNLNVFELKFLRDVSESMLDKPGKNGLNPKLEEAAKDDKWKSIIAKTNGLKSFGLGEKEKVSTKKI